MPSLADLTRAWLLRQLGLSSSELSEADLQAALYQQSENGGQVSNVKYASGRYYGPSTEVSTGTAAAVIDRLWVVPFLVGQRTRFDRISIEITTVGTTGNVERLGIYGTVNALPSNLIVDAGTVDGLVLGAPELVIDVTLNPGLYWLAMVSQVGVAANVRALGAGSSMYVGHTTAFLSSAFKSYRVDGVNGALPAVFGVPVADTTAPKPVLRAA